MKDKLVVYHGSNKIIEKPMFGEGNPNNDYGLGFYCTETLDLAKEWACSAETDGYANKYTLDLDGLKVLSLTSGEYNILNWLAILLENRKFRLSSDVAIEAKEYIFKHFLIDYSSALMGATLSAILKISALVTELGLYSITQLTSEVIVQQRNARSSFENQAPTISPTVQFSYSSGIVTTDSMDSICRPVTSAGSAS